MFTRFCPREIAYSLANVDLEKLKDQGIQGIILDLDNTLVHWNTTNFGSGAREWLARARSLGFELCLLSNSTTRRVRTIGANLEIPWVARALKPLLFSYRRALALLQTPPEATAVIGDQLFTDIWGGNRLGLYTILILPLSKRELVSTRLVRGCERRLLAYFRKRGMLPSG